MEVLVQMIRQIVDNPDDVKVSESQANRNVVLKVKVHDDDIGKLIGKDGRIINALRQLVRVCGRWETQRVLLELES